MVDSRNASFGQRDRRSVNRLLFFVFHPKRLAKQLAVIGFEIQQDRFVAIF